MPRNTLRLSAEQSAREQDRRASLANDALKPREDSQTLGALPIWDLTDLYRGMDAPEVKADLAHAASQSEAFEATYKGKLQELSELADGGARLAEAIAEYERVEEILGRLGAMPGLSTRRTLPTRRAQNSTGTCRNSSPPFQRACCSSSWS